MKQQLVETIKKALLAKKCDCGAPTLNESKQYAYPITEAMRYHLSNQIQIHENIFRPGSKAHVELIAETRTLWEKGIINLQDADLRLFENTDLGRFGLYEGEVVPLDLPMMEIITEAELEEELKLGDSIQINPKAFPNFEFPYGTIGKIVDISKADYASDDLVYTVKLKHIDSQGDENNTLNIEKPNQYLNEAEKKKQPALGKPHRGGSKKFYVYVKDPKTKRIKKVSFGMAGGGLRAKLNNPKARQAFSKRHNCPQKKDRTKASYWSCRLPRYAKLLGFKTTFSGYW